MSDNGGHFGDGHKGNRGGQGDAYRRVAAHIDDVAANCSRDGEKTINEVEEQRGEIDSE